MLRTAPWARIGIFVFLLSAVGQSLSAQESAKPASPGLPQFSAALTRYCFTCHSEKLKTGDLILSAKDIQNPGADPEVWEKVVRKLRSRSMPPAGAPHPD